MFLIDDMDPKFQTFTVSLPPSAHGNSGGKAFGAIPPFEKFPSGKRGKPGPFEAPKKTPRLATAKEPRFEEWVNYYVSLIGSKLEHLNALQFNLRKENETKQAKLMSDELVAWRMNSK